MRSFDWNEGKATFVFQSEEVSTNDSLSEEQLSEIAKLLEAQ